MRDDNCIFCKIANGEIPSATLYEDEEFRVILDLGPASKGHALILPKNHYRNLYDIDEATASKAICLAKKMITKMTDDLDVMVIISFRTTKRQLDRRYSISICT